jgi:hypothetical protein
MNQFSYLQPIVYSQDGSPTSYSKVSQAKITFKKVITTIALLSIAEKERLWTSRIIIN